MQVTDTIADLLTRIRNANSAGHASVEIPASRIKESIVKILLDEGYLKEYKLIKDQKQGILKVELRYLENKKPVISGLRRISKSGLRCYKGVKKIPKVMRGLGIAIVSTSKGLMTDRMARKENVGGEILASIW